MPLANSFAVARPFGLPGCSARSERRPMLQRPNGREARASEAGQNLRAVVAGSCCALGCSQDKDGPLGKVTTVAPRPEA